MSAALMVAATQALFQMRQFGRERAFDQYFRFTKTFGEISLDFHHSAVRFRQKDFTLDESMAISYFRRYWQLQLQQWEFFVAGLMPNEIYVNWMLYALDYFMDGRDFHYFDDKSNVCVLTFDDAFKTIGRRVLRNQKNCLVFFEKLHAAGQNGMLTENSADRREEIKRLVRSTMADEHFTKRWKL
ncbi:MAG TPA: hypothetical protein VMF58_03400 [Rhizomicrobium sp.]|nr:hypothetical protein [Rhizomicrobium sp.]